MSSYGTVMVTGATGRIGTHLIRTLLAEGREVRALCLPDDERGAQLAERGVHVIRGTLTDPETVAEAVGDSYVVVHLGAALTTRGAEPAAIVDSIALGTFNVVQALRVKRAVMPVLSYVSSTSVYVSGSSSRKDRADEESPTQPSTPYGAAKLASEAIVSMAAREGHLRAGIVRPCDTANPSELTNPGSVFGRRWFVRAALEHYAAVPPGTVDRVSELVHEQLSACGEQAELFTYRYTDGGQPLIQINDARSAAHAMTRLMPSQDGTEVLVRNIVPSVLWPMDRFIRRIAQLSGLGPESIVEVVVPDPPQQWIFETIHGRSVTDALSAATRHAGQVAVG